jgi:Ni2+-binding GTPase involved in maturation of urease and hydrogenase
MTKRMRFVMVGGFLGAGKTTTLARLAGVLQGRGQRVGLVTNDQAQNLVDTNSLRAQGFAVEEVPGACFCCRFDDLVATVGKLSERERPDVILAEPVGSCTDLVATVVQPLKDLYRERFSVAPYAVLFKPSHGLKILKDEHSAGFSPKAAYIFTKQLEEADAILLNRIDETPTQVLDEIADLVAARYPGTPMLRVSAKTGRGFDAVVELLDQEGDFGRKILDIDYDVYAEGEAELGWLNSSARLSAASPFALDDLLLEVIADLQHAVEGEVAHLKVIGLCDATFAVANLVATGVPAELSLPSRSKVAEADLIVNARVAMEPSVLEREVRRVVEEAGSRRGARVAFRQSQSLRPGRPVPTHRYPAVR